MRSIYIKNNFALNHFMYVILFQKLLIFDFTYLDESTKTKGRILPTPYLVFPHSQDKLAIARFNICENISRSLLGIPCIASSRNSIADCGKIASSSRPASVSQIRQIRRSFESRSRQTKLRSSIRSITPVKVPPTCCNLSPMLEVGKPSSCHKQHRTNQ